MFAGVLLGVASVLIAWRVGIAELGSVTFVELHRAMPVMWVVDLAPTVLGLAGILVGVLFSRIRDAREFAHELAEDIAAAWIEDLHQANSELAAAFATRDRFFATVTHELRTPLTSILGYAQLAEESGIQPHEARDCVAEISNSAAFLTEVVNDLLELARSSQAQLQLTIEDFDADGVVEEVIALLRPLADAGGVRLESRLAGKTPCRADATRLRQIVTNLIANAIKYSDGGTITVRTRTEEGWFTVEVADEGRGLSADELDRVFEPFHVVEHIDRRDSTGLGLALSRDLAEQMGGKLGAASEGRGTGATFWLALPVPEPARDAVRSTTTRA
jgi:signal transduction histidine kinase